MAHVHRIIDGQKNVMKICSREGRTRVTASPILDRSAIVMTEHDLDESYFWTLMNTGQVIYI